MRLPILLFLTVAITLLWTVQACEPDQSQNGCKIYGTTCTCGYGCKNEYIYKTWRACMSALRAKCGLRCNLEDGGGSAPILERSSNACYRLPCLRGICTQTVQDPGFACKCEGTGFYGQRCEKACPTVPMRGLIFPHECIVI